MKNLLTTIISGKDLKDLKEFITLLTRQGKAFLLRNDILLAFDQYCDINQKSKVFREKSSIITFFRKIQELFIREENIVMMHRYAVKIPLLPITQSR